MLIKNVRLIPVMLEIVLVYKRMCITGTWKMMKVVLIWTTILGMMVVTTVGCGSDDSPMKEDNSPITEEMPQSSIEPPNPYIAPILGTWHLQTITGFENDVVNQSMDFSSGLFTLTFKPDKTFKAINRYPIEVVADLEFLKWKGLEHIQEIVVTFPGKYGISEKQLRLDVGRARVEPKEAPEIDADFENPIFFYHVDQNARPMDYSLVNNGDQLELVHKKDVYRVEYILHRLKPE